MPQPDQEETPTPAIVPDNNPDPITPTIDPNEVYKQVLREAQAREAANTQRIRELEDKLNATQTLQPQNNPPAVNDADFWNQPASNLDAMISRQIAPLTSFIEETKKQQAYQVLKAQYKSYDGFNLIESYVDQFMSGRDPSHANMKQAIREAVGQVVLDGKLNQISPPTPPTNPTNPTPPTNQPNPQAHLRPTNVPSNPAPSNEPKRRPLTENERRLIREWGMTEEQWWRNTEAGVKVNDWKEPKK